MYLLSFSKEGFKEKRMSYNIDRFLILEIEGASSKHLIEFLPIIKRGCNAVAC